MRSEQAINVYHHDRHNKVALFTLLGSGASEKRIIVYKRENSESVDATITMHSVLIDIFSAKKGMPFIDGIGHGVTLLLISGNGS